MRIERAEYAGACYGVTRALDMAHRALDTYGEVCTLGSLIHNPQVVADLEQRGARVASGVDDIADCAVIIRSHGVAPAIRTELEERSVGIIDATCPHVARAQKAAAELAEQGCHVLVVGEKDHPEVEGLTACVRQAGGTFTVVGAPEGIPTDLSDPVGVVVQTTQTREIFDEIIAALNKRGLKPVIRDTICLATSQRQNAAAELAKRVDAMVVIGGRNSSNTTRLAEISSLYCERVYHIEAPDELHAYVAELVRCETVGVTAGASTPEDQIAQVLEFLEDMALTGTQGA